MRLDIHLFMSVRVICYVAKVFNMWRTNLLVFSVTPNHEMVNTQDPKAIKLFNIKAKVKRVHLSVRSNKHASNSKKL